MKTQNADNQHETPKNNNTESSEANIYLLELKQDVERAMAKYNFYAEAETLANFLRSIVHPGASWEAEAIKRGLYAAEDATAGRRICDEWSVDMTIRQIRESKTSDKELSARTWFNIQEEIDQDDPNDGGLKELFDGEPELESWYNKTKAELEKRVADYRQTVNTYKKHFHN